MLLMVERGIKGGRCHSINRYIKANNKYMKDYNKIGFNRKYVIRKKHIKSK